VLVRQVLGGPAGREKIAAFVEAIRSGEQQIEDADRDQGAIGPWRSLDYGFYHAFAWNELLSIALLHLFQGIVDVETLS